MNRRNILSTLILGFFTPKIENFVPENNSVELVGSLKTVEPTFVLDEKILKGIVESTLNKMTRQFYVENGMPQIKFVLDLTEEDDWASTAATG